MSSPSSPVNSPKRPGHGSRHGSSWISRLHRHHDRKHHSAEQEPLLADDQPDSDVEAQDAPPQPQSRLQGLRSTANRSYDEVAKFLKSVGNALKRFGNAILRNWKQILIACVLTLLTVLLSLLIGFYFRHKDEDNDKVSLSVCTSAACVHAASGILYNLDPKYGETASFNNSPTKAYSGRIDLVAKEISTDACTDFSKLVCGGFDEHHDLRPDQSNMFTGTLMVENSQTILRHILEGDASDISSADLPNFEKLKADYDACMDEKTIKDQGLEPLKKITDQITTFFAAPEAEWRASPVWSNRERQAQQIVGSTSTTQLTDASLYLMKLGIEPLLSTGIGADDKDPEVQVIGIGPPRLGLASKEYYKDKSILAQYQVMTAKVLEHFYQNSSSNSSIAPLIGKHFWPGGFSDLAKDVVVFETKLAALTPPPEDMNDITKTYNPMTFDEVAKTLPQISFEHIVTELAPKDYSADRVIVQSPAYLEGLSELLNNTSAEIVTAFLVWRTIQPWASRIEDPALKPLKQFYNVLQGKEPDAVAERWRTCIVSADGSLGWILSKFFVDKAFSPAAKEFGDQIVNDIKDSFVDFLTDASWMTENVRQRSIKKVHAIDQKIGYPTSNPDIMDPKALQRYYEDVSISNTTYFSNGLQVVDFEVKQEWSKLGKPTRHDEWSMTVPTVNAYYNPAGNEIVFPAGIMQHPVFYDPSVPQYLSYGAFGSVSGHELSHAFDNTGSQYDESGRYSSWWDNETRAAFENMTDCFIDQYARFTVPGPDGSLHVNGKLTLGENVADAGGVHAAFSAWKRREEESPSLGLPGLEFFTNEQLFFVNYANWWCGKITEEAAVQRIYLDPHAPMWARILGTMANSAEFRNAFNCPIKEPTCDLW